ncbi:hypothetical protein [Wenxinia marina]|uniref:Wenxma_14, whole genome shotgun sequence n=1 Tax=Wenxinia marina DSM 24838 TaxID=1123501 RepID=A0A0D0Q140_9RHOB|nr:hypothetical protein [Wenxinia marina]KIQ68269.1 hypothetical protein Wenmar_03107 [Wenxinia marina DSM 24838]GGL79279.1 hypothetical protein GCM10011392_37190 [Wenxinia marina]
MDERTPPGRVPDYTAAFLATTGVILFMAFLTLAAVAGFVWVLLTAAMCEAGVRLRSLRMRR